MEIILLNDFNKHYNVVITILYSMSKYYMFKLFQLLMVRNKAIYYQDQSSKSSDISGLDSTCFDM